MQERFIANLRKILEQGEERALLISATGTGKTYASAFAMRELGFKRVLFLVHRVTLAKQAKNLLKKLNICEPNVFFSLNSFLKAKYCSIHSILGAWCEKQFKLCVLPILVPPLGISNDL